jgi:hypothetical protein
VPALLSRLITGYPHPLGLWNHRVSTGIARKIRMTKELQAKSFEQRTYGPIFVGIVPIVMLMRAGQWCDESDVRRKVRRHKGAVEFFRNQRGRRQHRCPPFENPRKVGQPAPHRRAENNASFTQCWKRCATQNRSSALLGKISRDRQLGIPSWRTERETMGHLVKVVKS